MSSKDEVTFSKEALISTQSGKEILKQALMRSKGYKQFEKYKQKTEGEFGAFAKRFIESLYLQIISDNEPLTTMTKFTNEVGSEELLLQGNISNVKSKLSDPKILEDRVKRILNSNFVKMTFPVFNALIDGACEYFDEEILPEKRNAVVDGHIIAIDLSEPMDRIVDKDEDLEFLDDYKFLCPYILQIARKKIAEGGDSVSSAFEEGFKEARLGQYIDLRLKMQPTSINDELMVGCYKKYRAVMGTAGRNMALNRRPLSDIFHLGMAKAGECVGCGNEIEDAIKNGAIKIPSWPFYFAINTKDVKRAFELTMKKSELYLEEARLAVSMLPQDFQMGEFLEFLFLTVSHYNQYWFNVLNMHAPFDAFRKNINKVAAW